MKLSGKTKSDRSVFLCFYISLYIYIYSVYISLCCCDIFLFIKITIEWGTWCYSWNGNPCFKLNPIRCYVIYFELKSLLHASSLSVGLAIDSLHSFPVQLGNCRRPRWHASNAKEELISIIRLNSWVVYNTSDFLCFLSLSQSKWWCRRDSSQIQERLL